MTNKVSKKRFKKERDFFRRHGGILRTSEALKAGINRKALYAMRDMGLVEWLSRGIFRLKELPHLTNPDLVIAASRIPQGVICLISALVHHKLTTQIPHEIQIAILRGKKRPPQIDYPPVRSYQYSEKSFIAGIEIYEMDGMKVRIYSPEKTLADCFKFRNKIGMDVFLEALKLWRVRRNRKINKLLLYAKTNRVEKQIRPYLETHQ